MQASSIISACFCSLTKFHTQETAPVHPAGKVNSSKRCVFLQLHLASG